MTRTLIVGMASCPGPIFRVVSGVFDREAVFKYACHNSCVCESVSPILRPASSSASSPSRTSTTPIFPLPLSISQYWEGGEESVCECDWVQELRRLGGGAKHGHLRLLHRHPRQVERPRPQSSHYHSLSHNITRKLVVRVQDFAHRTRIGCVRVQRYNIVGIEILTTDAFIPRPK